MPRRLLFALIVFLAPAVASAAQTIVWDFTQSQVPGEWQIRNTDSATPTEAGLEIRTSTEASLARLTDTSASIDSVRFLFSSATPAQITFIWNDKGTPPDQVVRLPFSIPAGLSDIPLDMTVYPQWNHHPTLVGLFLPAGTHLTLRRIELVSLAPPDKLWNAWKTFWMFDDFTPMSINFLWGPIIRFVPTNPATLFATPPPQGWSANRVFLALLLLAALAALWQWRFRWWPKRSAVLLFLSIAGALWIFFDVRMGAELFRNAATDWNTYLSQPPDRRIFRSFEGFYTTLDQSLSILRSQPRYGLIAPPDLPIASRTQYFAYPSVGVGPTDGYGVTTWLVWQRPDARVRNGTLYFQDAIIARNGSIIRDFGNGSFLYQAAPASGSGSRETP